MANGVIKNPNAVEVLTPVVTKESGNSVVVSCSAKKSGNVVNIALELHNSIAATPAGSDSFTGFITGVPFPQDNVVGCSYYGSSAIMSAIDSVGHIVVRVLASQLAKGNNSYKISWFYLA